MQNIFYSGVDSALILGRTVPVVQLVQTKGAGVWGLWLRPHESGHFSLIFETA